MVIKLEPKDKMLFTVETKEVTQYWEIVVDSAGEPTLFKMGRILHGEKKNA